MVEFGNRDLRVVERDRDRSWPRTPLFRATGRSPAQPGHPEGGTPRRISGEISAARTEGQNDSRGTLIRLEEDEVVQERDQVGLIARRRRREGVARGDGLPAVLDDRLGQRGGA